MDLEPIGTAVPWVCTYWKDGRPYGITLWADDPLQILEDWCDRLDNLEVEGRLIDEL